MSDNTVKHIIKPKPLVSDPRVFFAVERTLLAWVRTGLAVMALGLVIGKFGLLLSVLTSTASHDQDLSHYLGIILILVGTLIVIGAQYNYYVYLPSLPAEDLPKQAIVRLDWFLTFSIGVTGVLLAIYLILA